MTPDTPEAPSRQEMIEAIQQKCVAANPEMGRVQKGAFVTGDGFHNAEILIVHENHPFMFCATVLRGGSQVMERVDFDKTQVKVAPRDPRLADVLLALKKNKDHHSPTVSEMMTLINRWLDGPDSLDDQDQPCIDFLFDLLHP